MPELSTFFIITQQNLGTRMLNISACFWRTPFEIFSRPCKKSPLVNVKPLYQFEIPFGTSANAGIRPTKVGWPSHSIPKGRVISSMSQSTVSVLSLVFRAHIVPLGSPPFLHEIPCNTIHTNIGNGTDRTSALSALSVLWVTAWYINEGRHL